jgi:hypothetical protein
VLISFYPLPIEIQNYNIYIKSVLVYSTKVRDAYFFYLSTHYLNRKKYNEQKASAKANIAATGTLVFYNLTELNTALSGDKWYMAGEDRSASNQGINLYSSDDLVTWKFERKIIPPSAYANVEVAQLQVPAVSVSNMPGGRVSVLLP